MADGTNYPGQDDIIARKKRLERAFKSWHDAMPDKMTLLVEYKPFEPAFYHTDIADWGHGVSVRQESRAERESSGRYRPSFAGHQYRTHRGDFAGRRNVGAVFHFNDRKYADDDLTLGSIDPYAVFRIFHEIRNAAERGVDVNQIFYMIDQSHNLKPKIQAMLQTALTAQELYAKACLVDRELLAQMQAKQDIVGAEECLKRAFYADIKPHLEEWRRGHDVPLDPLQAYRESDYESIVGVERERARLERGEVSGGSYA